jgi:hypothetical protein
MPTLSFKNGANAMYSDATASNGVLPVVHTGVQVHVDRLTIEVSETQSLGKWQQWRETVSLLRNKTKPKLLESFLDAKVEVSVLNFDCEANRRKGRGYSISVIFHGGISFWYGPSVGPTCKRHWSCPRQRGMFSFCHLNCQRKGRTTQIAAQFSALFALSCQLWSDCCLHLLTMAKTKRTPVKPVVTKYTKHVLPVRKSHPRQAHAHATDRYTVSPQPPGNLLLLVDKLLEDTPTVEEHYRSNLSTGQKKKGQDDDDSYFDPSAEDSEGADEEEENQSPPSKPKKSPPVARKPSKKGQNSGATGKNQNRGKRQETILSSDDEENGRIPTSKRHPSPVRGRKISPKGKNSDRTSQKHGRNDSQNSVQSISSTSTSNGFHDIQEEKEVRRVQDANRWVNEQTQSNKIILAYKNRVKQLQDSSHQKNLLIDELQVELTNLQHKFGVLENDNERVRAALLHVRNHPEELVRQITKKKGAKKMIMKKRSVDSGDTDGDGGATVDHNVISAMMSTGKDTVNIVYRTFKFINNEKQKAMFLELMLNNLGDANLIFLPNDSDERKAKVEEKRKLTVEEYGAYWISQLNVHRTYVQVSAGNL